MGLGLGLEKEFAMGRAKYKALQDLYVRGTEVVFDGPEGPVAMWVQVMNDFERGQCRKAAATARASLVMALRESDSEEMASLKGLFYSRSRDLNIADMLDSKFADWYVKCGEMVDNDPDWRERIDVLRGGGDRTDDDRSDGENELLAKLNKEYFEEIQRLVDEERELYKGDLERLAEVELFEEYEDRWLERQGRALAVNEFGLNEVFLVTRVCEATVPAEGERYDHSACNGHRDQVYESLSEVKCLPDAMVTPIRQAIDGLSMSERDARFSVRLPSSSTPSQEPSKQADSTPSIPTEIEPVPLGT